MTHKVSISLSVSRKKKARPNPGPNKDAPEGDDPPEDQDSADADENARKKPERKHEPGAKHRKDADAEGGGDEQVEEEPKADDNDAHTKYEKSAAVLPEGRQAFLPEARRLMRRRLAELRKQLRAIKLAYGTVTPGTTRPTSEDVERVSAAYDSLRREYKRRCKLDPALPPSKIVVDLKI